MPNSDTPDSINRRLVHDQAHCLAQDLVALIRHLIRDEEAADAFHEFYQLATKAIRNYAEAEARMRQRLRPESH